MRGKKIKSSRNKNYTLARECQNIKETDRLGPVQQREDAQVRRQGIGEYLYKVSWRDSEDAYMRNQPPADSGCSTVWARGPMYVLTLR